MRRHPVLGVWFVFVASIPFYVGKSGLPQPGNALLLLIVPWTLARWNGRLDPRPLRVLRALLAFIAWVWCVNYAWVLISGRIEVRDYAIAPLYYTFNLAIVLSGLILGRRHGVIFIRVTALAVLLMSVFQTLVSPFFMSGPRAEIFFNNPNQLGYWSLLAATLIAIAQRWSSMGTLRAGAGLLVCGYLSVLSGSRAAAGGVAILTVLLFFSNPRVVVAAVLASASLLVLRGGSNAALDSDAVQMLQRGDRGQSFSEERAYDRIWRFKEYALLGAGEGDYQRFARPGQTSTSEIHSSFGTVLFCYGIVGLVLFLRCIVLAFNRGDMGTSVLLVPVLVYSIAHQGLRFSMFWTVFAVYVVATALTKGRSLGARVLVAP
jgi:hypothetical protein